MRKPLSDNLIAALSRDFKDMFAKGSFERMTDLAEDDIKDPDLHRLVFYFDRSSYHRLRVLIDRLNAL